MRLSIYRIIDIAVSTLLFAGVLVLWLCYPGFLSYQEQYQLFLWDGEYFADRIAVAGGLADWLGEFVTQFYFHPELGAVLIAAVMTVIQLLLAALLPRTTLWRVLACLPPVLLTRAMLDENLLMSFPMALVLALMAAVALVRVPMRGWRFGAALLLGFVTVYWLAGPVAFVTVALVVMLNPGLSRRWLWLVVALAMAAAIVFAISRLLFVQHPESDMFLGINYYRITFMHPWPIFILAASIVLVAAATTIPVKYLQKGPGRTATAVAAVAMLAFAAIYIPTGIDHGKMEIFRYDWLVRHQRWADIIAEAERETPSNDFCLQALNLALAQTGQLTERMFEFPQHGIGSLMARYENNNTACLITAETFWHLGMINSAFRYNFDLQEAIMNDRRSGRFLKRMAECMILNGKYKVAAKYTDMLKKSLYYRKWAERAETYFDDDRVASHPEWQRMRDCRFKDEMLYDYPQIEKMLGMLAVDGGQSNRLAWDYFCAAAMLKGQLPMLGGMYHYASELYGERQIPRHIQEALAMYWTFGHQDLDSLPFAVSALVKQRLVGLAQAYGQSRDASSPALYPYADTFWLYYLAHAQQAVQPDTNASSRDD